MFWTVTQAAKYLSLELHQVYYLLVMGYIDAIKVGKGWRIVPEAVKTYDKRHSKIKDRGTPSNFIYCGCSGLLFDSLPDRLSNDLEKRTSSIQRQRRRMEYPAGRSDNILFEALEPIIQQELFSA